MNSTQTLHRTVFGLTLLLAPAAHAAGETVLDCDGSATDEVDELYNPVRAPCPGDAPADPADDADGERAPEPDADKTVPSGDPPRRSANRNGAMFAPGGIVGLSAILAFLAGGVSEVVITVTFTGALLGGMFIASPGLLSFIGFSPVLFIIVGMLGGIVAACAAVPSMFVSMAVLGIGLLVAGVVGWAGLSATAPAKRTDATTAAPDDAVAY